MQHDVQNRALSEVPSTTTIAGVRIGLIGDKFVVNPTTIEMEDSKLDLFLAGSESGILMIEVVTSFFFRYLKQIVNLILIILTVVFGVFGLIYCRVTATSFPKRSYFKQ